MLEYLVAYYCVKQDAPTDCMPNGILTVSGFMNGTKLSEDPKQVNDGFVLFSGSAKRV